MLKEDKDSKLRKLYSQISGLEYQIPKMTKMSIEQEVRKIKKELEKIMEEE